MLKSRLGYRLIFFFFVLFFLMFFCFPGSRVEGLSRYTNAVANGVQYQRACPVKCRSELPHQFWREQNGCARATTTLPNSLGTWKTDVCLPVDALLFCHAWCSILQLADSWAPYAASADAKRALGMEIHERLFTRYPDLLPLFEGADVVDLSKHLGESLEAVAKRIGDTCSVRETRDSEKII